MSEPATSVVIARNDDPEAVPDTKHNWPAIVLTAGVWGVLGAIAGQAIGRMGDGKKPASGTKIGRIFGAVVCTTIAVSAMLHNRAPGDHSKDAPAAPPEEKERSTLQNVAPASEVQAATSDGTLASAKGMALQA